MQMAIIVGFLLTTSARPLEVDGPWTYSQGSGALARNGVVLTSGYSGWRQGKNHADMEDQPDVGPIPHGVYLIGRPHTSSRHGPHAMTLTPAEGTETYGRFGFLIHGDSIEHPGEASEGCIILALRFRRMIADSQEDTLVVQP